MTDEPSALWIPSPFFFQGRGGYTPRYIILHGTAGGTSAQGVGGWFQDQRAQVSAHYVIGQDGTLVQCVLEQNAAWSNGGISVGHDSFWDPSINPNLLTISIEFVKSSTDNSDPLTDTQKQTGFSLIKRICQRWGIHIARADASGGITGHFSIDPVNRSQCPGAFDWPSFWKDLQMAINVPPGWTDDGTTLIASNGVPVVLGFRSYILNYPGWNPNNVPLAPEQHTSQVLLHNVTCGPGQIQYFRDSYLWYTPTQGIINETQLGSEIAALRAKITL